MRKKKFLKVVSLLACLSILLLSVPGVIASERTVKRSYTDRFITKTATMLFSLFPLLNLKANYEKGSTSSDQTLSNDSVKKVKNTGTMVSMKGPRTGD
jgi:hypothetical protein